MTVSSGNSSLESLDRMRSAAEKVNAIFIDAAQKGDTTLLITWIKNNARRSQLYQESFNIALVELSKNVDHKSRRVEAINVLLDKCTYNLKYKDTKFGHTPLIWAAIFDREDIVEILINKGASLEVVDESCKRTPLSWAANRGALKTVKALLDHILDQQLIQLVNTKDGDGNTALVLAYTRKHFLTA